ncbi:MAG: alpha/beta hydrolase [Sandaracinaceae bacterium]|nr:alpha/beta hydrolase [Sandaracinaceae bacterium]
MKLLLLPGMDGTGLLFERFAAALPPSIEPVVCRYPPSAHRYHDLRSHVPLPSEPFAILAESFSGPLGIRLAAERSDVRALVLVASFASAPRRWLTTPLARALPPLVAAFPPPRAIVRAVLLGNDPGAPIDEVLAVLATVARATLAARLRAVMTADVAALLDRIEAPLLYLAGARDRLVPPSIGHALVAGRGRFEALDAPHLVLQTRPREAAARVAAFLAACNDRP